MALALPQGAGAQAQARGGKEVVDAVCGACHSTGSGGAPRIGDQRAWNRLAARGLTGLTESAIKGIRGMPPHGGNPGLSDLEIERAITHMVNQSGGRWVTPIDGMTPALVRQGRQIVEAQCAKCHRTGAGGAPRIGERAAWIPRLRQGFEYAVRSAINGHGPMPPRGGMADLTDAELRSAVAYMFNPEGAAAKQAKSAAPAVPAANRKLVDGVEVFLGVLPAQALRDRAGKQAKAAPPAIPEGEGYYHVNVSLFDARTRAAIGDAQVEVRVSEPVSGGETKKLEPVTLNNFKSYGGYFRMTSPNPYRISITVRTPGSTREVHADFDYKRG